MLSRTIAVLKKLDAAPEKALPTRDLLRITDFSRSELFRIFMGLEHAGVVSQTRLTFLGDVQGYRLKKNLSEISLLTVMDAVDTCAELWSVTGLKSTEGYRAYRSAVEACRKELSGIYLTQF